MTEPGYWMDEIGGELAPAIERYLNRQALSPRDIQLIRLYLQQWIDAGVWDTNPEMTDEGRAALAGLRQRAHAIVTLRDIDAWIEAAVDFEVDPL